MPKEPKPNFASFTKAELVKTVKKLDARQTKLLNEIAALKVRVAELEADCMPPPPRSAQDVLNAMDTPRVYSDTAALRDEWEREPPAEDWQDANQGEVNSGRMFPWEKD